jgi:cytochrome c-type biogenesis protein CcmF
MIAEFGQFALILSLLAALVQATLSLAGAQRNDGRLMAAGTQSALLQALLIAISFACLLAVHVGDDFSVLNVVQNSHTQKPLLYKFAGAWGNHEGSMLLWVLILALFGGAVALFGRHVPPTLKARAIGVQALVGVGFLVFVLFASNPFTRIFPVPLDGNDLNPILQDPALAAHPPFLYLGYVGFSIAYSFAVAALLEGRVDPAWARWVRPWTLAAWSCLTLGIGLGSWWAYYELGWGGWWFWDPVENASLMPWLAGTALLHSAIVVEKRGAMKSWTILLAILTFSLSLLGTFLVRSGILSSVHAFAVDPLRGVFVLFLLAAAVGGALAVYAWRAPSLAMGGLFRPISREGGLVLNNLLLTTGCATVFAGTLYPLFLDATEGRSVTVGPPFYALTFVPLMVPLLAVMGIGPLLSWKRADLEGVLQRLRFAGGMTAIVLLVVLWFQKGGPVLALLGLGLATWVVAAALSELAERVRLFRIPLSHSLARALALPGSAWGAALGHAGLGIASAGMTGSALWKAETITRLSPGESASVAMYTLRLERLTPSEGPNYSAVRGTFTVLRGGMAIGTLSPERRSYPVQKQTTTEAAIRTNGFADLHAVIGDPDPNDANRVTVRLYHHPLVPWIWIGSVIMVAGGVLSLSDRRLRVGAPRVRRRVSNEDAAMAAAAE